MKPSGIEWIGYIPDDWKVLKYKYAGRFEKGKLPKFINRENKGSPIIGASEMNGGLPILFTEDSDIPKCRKDDVLFLWDGANAGLVSSGLDGILSSTVVKYVCTNNINIKYLFYLTKYYEKYFKSKVNGTTIPHMSYDFINDCPLLEPPLQTQQRIADYLDEKCGEIDATISKQKESIEKLKAYKQSLISETVTKGLDKSAPLKPSGIDYLGDIPSHWEIKKLKFLVSLIDNKTKDGHSISLENIESGTGKLIETENTYDGEGISFKENDLLFGKLRPYLAKVYLSALKGRALGDFYVMRANKGTNPNFLKFVLLSDWFIKIVDSSTYGTKMPRASWDFTGGMRIPLPPISEQDCISSYLEIKCSEVDTFIIEKQNIIQKLDAYKKSLIFECVTGKKRI